MASVQQELETSFPIYGSWDYPLQDPQYQSNLRSPRQLYKVVHPELPSGYRNLAFHVAPFSRSLVTESSHFFFIDKLG